jgi:hypothetical protein
MKRQYTNAEPILVITQLQFWLEPLGFGLVRRFVV